MTKNPLAIDWPGGIVGPRKDGLFIRLTLPSTPAAAGQASSGPGSPLELVVGRWGLIPWFADTPNIRYSTNNARSEELATKASFKHAWARGQRCIIPAAWFDEPNWESGKNVWWRFRRADSATWGLAGLWGTWTDRATGEVLQSYTMLTINADDHPLMRRMHKPDPAIAADAQDKRSVIAIELADVEQWLHGSLQDAKELLRPPPLELIHAGPSAEMGDLT